MAYNPESEFPANVFSKTDLTNTPVNVGPTTPTKPTFRMAWGVIIGGAAAEVVTFRSRDGNTDYFSVNVPIAAVVPLRGMQFPGDLEILTDSAAGDVGVVIAWPV